MLFSTLGLDRSMETLPPIPPSVPFPIAPAPGRMLVVALGLSRSAQALSPSASRAVSGYHNLKRLRLAPTERRLRKFSHGRSEQLRHQPSLVRVAAVSRFPLSTKRGGTGPPPSPFRRSFRLQAQRRRSSLGLGQHALALLPPRPLPSIWRDQR